MEVRHSVARVHCRTAESTFFWWHGTTQFRQVQLGLEIYRHSFLGGPRFFLDEVAATSNEQRKGYIKVVSIIRWDGLRVPRKRRTCYMVQTTLYEQIYLLEIVWAHGLHFKHMKYMRCSQESKAQKSACKFFCSST